MVAADHDLTETNGPYSVVNDFSPFVSSRADFWGSSFGISIPSLHRFRESHGLLRVC